jgi:phytoene desaturase
MKNKKTVIVLGGGFSGLSAASTLAHMGFSVKLIEKNEQTGGRARVYKESGFVFDMGPSWYWMPDVIEKFFNRFGKSVNDYFELERLNPSYQVIYENGETVKLPADFSELKDVFEKIETGSGKQLDLFLKEAKYKYDVGMKDFVYKPSIRFSEFTDWRLVSSLFRLDMFSSFSKHTGKYFQNPRLRHLLEFPVLFLGAMPSKTPAMYSLMNYADMKLGTWYPKGGMYKLVEAMTALAVELGVEIILDEPVKKIEVQEKNAKYVLTDKNTYTADIIVASADYNHVEQMLLGKTQRNYSDKYWTTRSMSPSSLIYYIGLNKKLKKLIHHNLFFDADFDKHIDAIYKKPEWPSDPLFYLCCPSVTDESVAPAGMENLFILIPIPAGLEDTPEIKETYFKKVISRLEKYCGESIQDSIIVKRSYAGSDFISDYNAFKGNAYGLANTLMQTAFLRPSMRNKKINNLFYTGQLTVPGPGVPPSIISGQVVAGYVSKLFN